MIVIGNHDIDGPGAGIFNWGHLVMNDSTVTGNEATAPGGFFNVDDPADPSSLATTGATSVADNIPDDVASGISS